jgi:polyphosphate kinase
MIPYINREKSWLEFNKRVMQEAEDESVPLIERIRFIGIFSNNLDEFFRVRFAYVRRIFVAGKSGKREFGESAKQLLNDLTEISNKQQEKAAKVLSKLTSELEKENVFILDENNLNDDHKLFVRNFFVEKISPSLMTIMLDQVDDMPNLKDEVIYLAIEMNNNLEGTEQVNYALIEIPTKQHGRFIVLPSIGQNKYIMLLEDLIRFNLSYIFRFFDYNSFKGHTVKITRDAELDIDNDISSSFIDKVSRSLQKRVTSEAVRFVYDSNISERFLEKLKRIFSIDEFDNLSAGGRYHNKSDYMKFPNLGPEHWEYKKITRLPIQGLDLYNSIFEQIKNKDYLLHTPYHNYSYVVSFLKEAALDPKVETIKITIYRVADNSRIINALINAARNGKNVVVQIELRARFDEAANIYWAEKMKAEGIHLVFGIRGLKVHAKIGIIERNEGGILMSYGFISTGNFNEATAKVYTDYTLFTSNQGVLKDVNRLFSFFEASYQVNKYKHLIVSPHFSRKEFLKMINKEITIAKSGGDAFIDMRMNSLVDKKLIEKLYEASNEGVKMRLVVRGVCSLVPGVEGYSENIEVISIVDKFLEHPRVYIFGNGGKEKVFISSADLMTRNLDHRVEVTCPIYDEDIKNEIKDHFEIMWSDNTKARCFNKDRSYTYREKMPEVKRAHFDTYDYYLKKLKN